MAKRLYVYESTSTRDNYPAKLKMGAEVGCPGKAEGFAGSQLRIGGLTPTERADLDESREGV